jgi:predicted dehydrogenase
MIRVVLVGLGAWGRNYLRALQKLPDVQVAMVCKRDARALPDDLGPVEVTTDLGAAVAVADAAIIATPPAAHLPTALPFLQAGIPTLLEKPVAESWADTRALFDAARAHGTPLLIDHIHLFAPAFEALRQAALGWGALRIESTGGNYGPFRATSPLLDWGPHDLAMALALIGGAPDQFAVRRCEGKSPGTNYELRVTRGDSEAMARVGNGMAQKSRSVHVAAREHQGTYDDLAPHKLIVDGVPVEVSARSPLEAVVRALLDCAAHGTTDWRWDAQLSLDVMRILTGAQEPAP